MKTKWIVAAVLAIVAGSAAIPAAGVGRDGPYWGPVPRHQCDQGGPTQAPSCYLVQGSGANEVVTPKPGGTSDAPLYLDGIGVIAHKTHRLCYQQAGWATDHAFNVHGIDGEYNFVWARNPASGHHPEPMVLVCGRGWQVINANTTGPGADGISMPCPVIGGHQSRPAGGGATVSIHLPQNYTLDPHQFSQITGGFGSEDDGYWNYRFHALREGDVQMWGFCRYWHDRG